MSVTSNSWCHLQILLMGGRTTEGGAEQWRYGQKYTDSFRMSETATKRDRQKEEGEM